MPKTCTPNSNRGSLLGLILVILGSSKKMFVKISGKPPLDMKFLYIQKIRNILENFIIYQPQQFFKRSSKQITKSQYPR